MQQSYQFLHESLDKSALLLGLPLAARPEGIGAGRTGCNHCSSGRGGCSLCSCYGIAEFTPARQVAEVQVRLDAEGSRGGAHDRNDKVIGQHSAGPSWKLKVAVRGHGKEAAASIRRTRTLFPVLVTLESFGKSLLTSDDDSARPSAWRQTTSRSLRRIAQGDREQEQLYGRLLFLRSGQMNSYPAPCI